MCHGSYFHCTLNPFELLLISVAYSLANSLVITAVGGGTEVIPFLTGAALL